MLSLQLQAKAEIERRRRKRGGKTFDIQTDDALWKFCHDVLGVAIPRMSCCAGHVAPFQAFADAYFARSRISIWKASRGFGGKSFLLALLAVTEQIALGASVNLLGGSGEQSLRVHGYLAGTDPNSGGMFWDAPNAPRALLASDIKKESRTTNGGMIRALMASQTSVRGPHPQRLRLDEIDEMSQPIFDAAMGQTMAARGIKAQTVCSSTHQNPDGTMTEALKRASEGAWPVYEWCYRESLEPHGWLPASEVEEKRTEIPKAMWDSEYDLQEPNPEGRAIDGDAVEALFDRSLGEYEGDVGEHIIVVEPDEELEFVTGTDWAKSRDWTIIHTNQRTDEGPDLLAAWLRVGRKPWPAMIADHDRRLDTYDGTAVHDATGVGSVIDDYLESGSEGFDFTGRKARDAMLTAYIAAIENGELVYPWIRYAYNEHKYATNDDIYSGRPGHLPDSISAGALAKYALGTGSIFW